MKTSRASFIFLSMMAALSSCVTVEIPLEEYTVARSARDAAIAAEAAKYAPQLFYRADKAYKRGEALFKERYYSDAQNEFVEAQKLAEKAETAARIKQFQSGESNGGY